MRNGFRNHIINNELIDGVTREGLVDCYRQLIKDFKTNDIGTIWEKHSDDKAELAYELNTHPISIDQWEYYFNTIFKLEELKLWIYELKKSSNKAKGSKKKATVSSPVKIRETMTFKRKSSVLDGHLTLLFDTLIKEGWIEGNEADFKALFSGRRDKDCIITWSDKFGKAALFTLFKAFSQEELIIIPDGFAISSILEGHFKGKTGEWLSGLDKGNKAHSAAMPVIMECVKLLKKDAARLINGDFQDDEDFKSVYDSYDHQDLQLHNR